MTAAERVRVVVCDDDPIFSDVVAMLIAMDEHLDLVAAPYPTGQQAIDAVRRHNPEIVLMDVDLIGSLNGFQATVHILEISPMTTVVIMSGSSDEEDTRLKAIEAGAVSFLPKSGINGDLPWILRSAVARAQAGPGVEEQIDVRGDWIR